MKSPTDNDLEKNLANIGYTIRRFYIDKFYLHHIAGLPRNTHILDMGGGAERKRGVFDVADFDVNVVSINLTTEKKPHVQGDASKLPFKENIFDAVICSELLEHVPSPPAILGEMFRVLKPSGVIYCCVPFNYRIHGDPEDFGRYTDHYWRIELTNYGFENIDIEKQGLFWSVLAEMIRGHVAETFRDGKIRNSLLRKILTKGVYLFEKKALQWDATAKVREHQFYNSSTTGFGFVANKKG